MAAEQIRLETYGIAEAERALVKMIALLTDLRPFWPRLVPLFIGWMREQFDTEGDWGGGHWAPLSPDYAAWKTAHYPGRGILYATGDLRRSASNPARFVSPMMMSLTITDPKAGYHQEGTERMPARKIIPMVLPPYAQDEVRQAAEEYVAEMARRIGVTTV